MRRWLPLALLIVVAGLIGLVLRWHSNPAEPIAAAPASDSKAATPALVFSTEPARERTAAAAAPATPPGFETAKLVLRVRNQRTHAPLSGVRVKALARATPNSELRHGTDSAEPHGDLRVHPKTGADGIADLEVPPGVELRVWVSCESESSSETCLDIAPLAEGEAREMDVELLPPNDARVVGRVVDYLTKAPIAGASVRLVRSDMFSSPTGETAWHNDVLASAKSRADGSFEFTFTSWVLPHLQIDAEGYSRALLAVSTRHADAAHALVVEMLPECRLIVHVIDASGSAVPGVYVSVDSQGWGAADEVERAADDPRAMISDQSWSANTKADGRATIAGLPTSMELRVKGVKDHRTLWSEPEPIQLEFGQTRELEWRVGGGTRVSGIVLDQTGAAVPRQELWLTTGYLGEPRYFSSYDRSSVRFRGTTDDAGRFAFEDVPEGRWAIGPAAEEFSARTPCEYGLAPKVLTFELAGEPARELTLHVERGLCVRGTVLAPGHASLHGAHIHCLGGDGLGVAVAVDGAFVLGPLASGECTLVASCQGQYADSQPVRASAGDTDVKLQLRLGGSLRGMVIDAATGQPCKASIVYSPEVQSLGPNGCQSGTSVGSDGTFTHPALAPGRYDVAAMSDDGRCAVQSGIEISAGVDTTGIVLALKPGGWVTFTYHGMKDTLNVTARSAGVPLSFPLSIRPNRWEAVNAPAGSVTLEIRKEYGSAPRTRVVELKAGEKQEIVLTDED